MLVIWQSLLKAVREDNQRIWLQNQWPSSWGRALAQLGRVGRASTNTGRFRVGGSRCGPRQARLRKTCYHSCDTDSVRESKMVLMLCRYRATTSHFFLNVSRMNWREVVADQGSAHHIGTKQHVPNRILCKAALSWRPVRGKGVCSDSNWTAQQLQMAAHKGLETNRCLAW